MRGLILEKIILIIFFFVSLLILVILVYFNWGSAEVKTLLLKIIINLNVAKECNNLNISYETVAHSINTTKTIL